MIPVFDDAFPMLAEVECDTTPGSPNFHLPLPNCPPIAVAFGLFPLKDEKLSTDEGRPIYRDVEFVKIAVPGDRNSLVFQPATQKHRDRFPRAYRAFKERSQTATEGTPLEQWPQVSPSVVLNLKALHIFTVESLAQVHDGHVERIGTNGRNLRAMAQAYISKAKEGAEAAKMAKENQELQNQITGLQAQLAQLIERMNEDKARIEDEAQDLSPIPEKRGPGRPPKDRPHPLPQGA